MWGMLVRADKQPGDQGGGWLAQRIENRADKEQWLCPCTRTERTETPADTPTGTNKHRRSVHTANSQAPAGTQPCAHTRPLGPHSLHTVSGRFLSLSSLRSKHWLIMGFSELHKVCEGRARDRGCSRTDSWGIGHSGPNPESSPQSPSPPSGSGRAGHCFYPETLGGESTCEPRKSPLPPAVGTQPSILTGHAVGHFPSVVQEAELPAAQGFPGALVSQLVPGGDRERKLVCWPEPCSLP